MLELGKRLYFWGLVMDELRSIIRDVLEEYAPNSEAVQKDKLTEELLIRLADREKIMDESEFITLYHDTKVETITVEVLHELLLFERLRPYFKGPPIKIINEGKLSEALGG